MKWFEDDEFWTTFAPYMFSEDIIREAPREVEQMLALTGLQKPQVLDLCCGVGRHTVEFARNGCRVTGVDRTRSSLDRARARAAEARVDVEFIQQDMREFRRPGGFDLIVNVFTSFGYFDDQADDLKVLRHAYEALRPGGALVLELMGKEVLARVFVDTRSATLPDGTVLVWRTWVTADWTRITGEWYAIRGEQAKRFVVAHWIYSAQELRDLLRQSGFQDMRLCGGLDGRPYDVNAQRLVAVARR